MTRPDLRRRVLNLAKWGCYAFGGFQMLMPLLMGLGVLLGIASGKMTTELNALQVVGLGAGVTASAIVQGGLYVVIGMAFSMILDMGKELELIA